MAPRLHFCDPLTVETMPGITLEEASRICLACIWARCSWSLWITSRCGTRSQVKAMVGKFHKRGCVSGDLHYAGNCAPR